MEQAGHFLGLRTVIYAAPDLAMAKEWYSKAFGVDPYFDEPFYVGYNIGGYELGLDPNGENPGPGGVTAWWGVESMDAAMTRLASIGAEVASAPRDTGDGIRVASVVDPFGNHVGIIENPHFDPAATK